MIQLKKNPPDMHRDSRDEKSFEKESNILNASIALLSLCITVIALFQITDKRKEYHADELFSIASALLLLALITSYLYTRKDSGEILRKIADAAFISALGSMLVAGTYLVLEL